MYIQSILTSSELPQYADFVQELLISLYPLNMLSKYVTTLLYNVSCEIKQNFNPI